MSSTEKPASTAASEFFDRFLVDLARETQEGGRGFFPRGPEPGHSTYYVNRQRTALRREDFEAPVYHDGPSLAAELRKLWGGAEDAPLAALSEEFGALAESLAKKSEQTWDVSPFIYVMF